MVPWVSLAAAVIGLMASLLKIKFVADLFGNTKTLEAFNWELVFLLTTIFTLVALAISKIGLTIDTEMASQNVAIARSLGLRIPGQNVKSLTPKTQKHLKKELDRAQENLSQLEKYISFAIIIWIFFYGIKLFEFVIPYIYSGYTDFIKENHIVKYVIDSACNLTNIANTACLFICYYILSFTKPTVDSKLNPFPKFKIARYIHFWVGLGIFSLLIFDIGIKIFCYNGGQSNEIKIINLALVQLCIGILAGIVLALVTGRLDSKFLRPKNRYITVLYLYAVAQVAYPLLEMKYSPAVKTESIKEVFDFLLNASLLIGIFGKIALMYLIDHAHVNRTLLLYFLRLKTYDGISKKATKDFKIFLDPYIDENSE